MRRYLPLLVHAFAWRGVSSMERGHSGGPCQTAWAAWSATYAVEW